MFACFDFPMVFSGVGRCLILGGAKIFFVTYSCIHYACTCLFFNYVCKY